MAGDRKTEVLRCWGGRGWVRRPKALVAWETSQEPRADEEGKTYINTLEERHTSEAKWKG